MLLVERWILARLRNRQFFSLDRQPTNVPATTSPLPSHENVPGPDYYH